MKCKVSVLMALAMLFAGLVGVVGTAFAKAKDLVDFRALVPTDVDQKKVTYVVAPEMALGGTDYEYLEVAADASGQVLYLWLSEGRMVVTTYTLKGSKKKQDCMSCHPGEGFGGGGAQPAGPGPSEPGAPRTSTASGEKPADTDSAGTSTSGSRGETPDKPADTTKKKPPPKRRLVTGGFTLSVVQKGKILVDKYEIDPTSVVLKGPGPFEISLEGTTGPAPLLVYVGRSDESDPKSPLAVRAKTRVVKK